MEYIPQLFQIIEIILEYIPLLIFNNHSAFIVINDPPFRPDNEYYYTDTYKKFTVIYKWWILYIICQLFPNSGKKFAGDYKIFIGICK